MVCVFEMGDEDKSKIVHFCTGSDTDDDVNEETKQNTLANLRSEFPQLSSPCAPMAPYLQAQHHGCSSETMAGGMIPGARIQHPGDLSVDDTFIETQRARMLQNYAAQTSTDGSSTDVESNRHNEKQDKEVDPPDPDTCSKASTINSKEDGKGKSSSFSRFKKFVRRRAKINTGSDSSSKKRGGYEKEARRIAQKLVDQHSDSAKTQDPLSRFQDPTPKLQEAIEHPSEFEKKQKNAALEGPRGYSGPSQVRTGVLGSLLKLYSDQDKKDKLTPTSSRTPTPNVTPSHSVTALSSLKKLPKPKLPRSSSADSVKHALHREKSEHTNVASALAASTLNAFSAPLTSEEHWLDREKKKKKLKYVEEQQKLNITVHIADLLQRQRFLLRFGRALMLFGAPSHRLEEFMYLSSRVLQIDGQFMYFPGCMVIAFGDASTHTSETILLRSAQGLNLWKLQQTHLIFKQLVHGLIKLEDAAARIDALLSDPNMYPTWMLILFFALGSGFCALFAYGAKWQDFPMTIFLGSIVAFLQMWAAPRSALFSNVFEVSACILTSFLARAFGSIYYNKDRVGDTVFCFGSIAQGSISLILPGYIILTGALELQAKNMVTGAVRMFYAIIYSMFLTFGITLGTAIYGWCDEKASTAVTCTGLDDRWKILTVPLSAMFLALTNHASPTQLPTMVLIASAGYVVLYMVQTKTSNANAFTSALGAFTTGLLGNLWSRLGHGLAFAAMVPSILVIVPSGIAAQGSLITGVNIATALVKNQTEDSTSSTANFTSLGGTMTQVAIGITVGLFVATLMIYPVGTTAKKSALFTF